MVRTRQQVRKGMRMFNLLRLPAIKVMAERTGKASEPSFHGHTATRRSGCCVADLPGNLQLQRNHPLMKVA